MVNLGELQSQYVAAVKKSLRAAMTVGLSSAAVRDAEKEAGLAARRIEEILLGNPVGIRGATNA